jgi:branched-chain amino acid transport system substrate-binding protein
MADRVGQLCGNYRLIRLLGRGGFADVYLGQHQRLSAQFAAIKILHERLSPEDIQVFEREAQTVASLLHPHIVRLLDYDVIDNVPFLVMDYAPKGSLRQRHRKGERVPLRTVVSYVSQVAEGLQYAHDKKIIHRDVKPDNMLVGIHDEIVLNDFGIATIAHSTGSLSIQAALGTVSYMAPEQIQEYPRPASDQYALGVSAYEWLTGERPFQGSLTEIVGKHAMMPPPSLRDKLPNLAPSVEQVVWRAMAKEPQRRFASVRDFAYALEEASQEASTVVITPRLPYSFTDPISQPVWPQIPANEAGKAEDDDPTVHIVPPSSPISAPINRPLTPTPTVSSGPYNYPLTPVPPFTPMPPPLPGYGQPLASGPPSSIQPVAPPRRKLRLGLTVPLILASLLLVAGIISIPLVRARWFGGGSSKLTSDEATAYAHATVSAIAGTAISANGGQVATLKIAADLPLSGTDKSHGRQAKDGAQMAIDEANSANFLPGYNLVFDPVDDASDPNVGQQRVNSLIRDAEVAGIVGPLDSTIAMAEMPLSNRAPLAQISPVATDTCLTQNAPTTVCTGTNNLLPTLRPTGKVTYFRLSTTSDQEGAASADYTFKTLHYKTAFVIDDTKPYGLGLASTFIQRFQADGGTVLGHDSLPSSTDYSQELTNIANLQPDIIYFAGKDVASSITIRQQMASTSGLQNTPFEGGDRIRTSAFAKAVGAGGAPTYTAVVTLDAAQIATNDPQFVRQYQARYGQSPVGDISVSSYDSTKILLNAIKAALQAGVRAPLHSNDAKVASIFRQAVIDQIARTNYNGVTGHQSFDMNGDTTNKTLAIYRLVDVASEPDWKYVGFERL